MRDMGQGSAGMSRGLRAFVCAKRNNAVVAVVYNIRDRGIRESPSFGIMLSERSFETCSFW